MVTDKWDSAWKRKFTGGYFPCLDLITALPTFPHEVKIFSSGDSGLLFNSSKSIKILHSLHRIPGYSGGNLLCYD